MANGLAASALLTHTFLGSLDRHAFLGRVEEVDEAERFGDILLNGTVFYSNQFAQHDRLTANEQAIPDMALQEIWPRAITRQFLAERSFTSPPLIMID